MDFSTLLVPLLLSFVAVFGLIRRVDVYTAATPGTCETSLSASSPVRRTGSPPWNPPPTRTSSPSPRRTGRCICSGPRGQWTSWGSWPRRSWRSWASRRRRRLCSSSVPSAGAGRWLSAVSSWPPTGRIPISPRRYRQYRRHPHRRENIEGTLRPQRRPDPRHRGGQELDGGGIEHHQPAQLAGEWEWRWPGCGR